MSKKYKKKVKVIKTLRKKKNYLKEYGNQAVDTTPPPPPGGGG